MKLLSPATKVLSIIALCFVFFVSCKKDEDTLPPTNPPTGSINGVYIAGMVDKRAVIWKDSVLTFLTPVSPSGTMAFAIKVLVYNNNVYILGAIQSGGLTAIKLWKNGVESTVATGLRGVVNNLSFDVYNDDVYVCCITENESNQNRYWKNGNIITLDKGGYTKEIEITDIKVKNGNVYVLGDVYDEPNTGEKVVYWVNGVINTLPNTSRITYSQSLFINDNDIYILGRDGLRSAYWKNTIKTILAPQPPYTYASLSSLFVNNNDVYIAGNQDYVGQQNNTNYSNATYWKNNTINISTNYNSNNYYGIFRDIFVKNNIVYSVGFADTPTGTTPLYFQNNVPMPLSGITSTQKVYLLSIFVH